MLTSQLQPELPSPAELPDSDGKPVDNELQYLIPTLLRNSLEAYWANQTDWCFGINLGIYHNTPGFNPRKAIVPDGFLSLGVPPPTDPKGRLSYIVWLENNVVPIFALECVSQTYGEEYGEKMTTYQQMGVLYYAIYNPFHYRRDKHTPFEVYHLVRGIYELQTGPRIWLPKLGLSLGCEWGTFYRWKREWLYWYDRDGNRLFTPQERAELAHLQMAVAERDAEEERYRAEEAEAVAEQQRQRADQECQRADQERQRADLEQQRAEEAQRLIEQERQRADLERQRAQEAQCLVEQQRQRAEWEQQRAEQAQRDLELERQRAERLATWLRQQGIEPTNLE